MNTPDPENATTEEPVGTENPGITMIKAERLRQIAAEGYTPEHDAEHPDGELARAGATYALWAAGTVRPGSIPYDAMRWWPPDWKFGYDDGPVRALAKAGALIAAEIDRLTAKGCVL